MTFSERPPLSGQAALVTGSSRGIGRAIALALARGGAAVAVNYQQDGAAAAAVVAEIEKGGGSAFAIPGDVAEPAVCERLVRETEDRYGKLDILVHNAGHALEKLLMETELAEWERMMAVHLRAAYLLCRHALPGMASRRYGRIIVVSSIWGMTGGAYEVAYSSAKAGQIGLIKALAREVGPWGITVNTVAPGWIDTEMNQSLAGPAAEAWVEKTPVGRLGTPEEVAEAVCYLAGSGAGFMTGQVLSPNGGVVT